MVEFPWGRSSLPRVTPPLQRELLRLIPKSCPSPRDAIEHPRDTEDARVQFSPARTTAMTLKQQLEYDARLSGNIKLKILMEPLDTQS